MNNDQNFDVTGLSQEQKKTLEVLANYCLSYYYETEPVRKEQFRNQVNAVNHVAVILNIPYEKRIAVENGNIKGLQNINRFGSVTYFETNYNFNK